MYCTDIAQLLPKLEKTEYQTEYWRLLIYTRNWLLKCVLLHSGYQFAFVPLGPLAALKEKYEVWSTCWRKFVILNTIGWFALTWRWGTFCWDNSLGLPSIRVFFACETIETEFTITLKRTGQYERNWSPCRFHQQSADGQREDTFSTSTHSTLFDNAAHQIFKQRWKLLYILFL